nr:copia protein [Tanacetum cinerariifolium]
MCFFVWSSGSTNPQNYDGDATFDEKEHDFDAKESESEVILSPSSSAQSRKQDDKTKKEAKGKSPVESFTRYRDLNAEFKDCSDNSSNEVNASGFIVPTVKQNSLNNNNNFSAAGPSNAAVSQTYGKSSFIDASQLPDDLDMPELEDITYFDEDVVGAEANFKNLESSIPEEPKRVHQALKDPSWIEAMQEELLQFKMQKVWVLVDLPHEKLAIGTKWVYRNEKDERGIVIRNKGKLVTQGHIQEEGIDYEEVFAPVARIEAIRLILAYASFMGFMVYQMDVKSAFLYRTIKEEVLIKGKLASTPIDTEKPLLKDPDGEDVDVHTYSDSKSFTPSCSKKDLKISKRQATLRLVEMILLLMEKFLLSFKNHPYHLLLHLLHHHNYLKIFHQHPRYTILHHNHLRRVEHLEYDKVAQALEIKKLKRRVKKLEKGNRVKMLKLQRLKRVGTLQRVNTSEDTVMDATSNQGRIIDELDKDDVVAFMDDKEEDKKDEEAEVDENAQEDEPAKVQDVVDVVTTAKLITELNKDIDWDAAIDHVKQKAKEDPTVQRYQVMKRKPQTEAQAQKNLIMYLKNVAGFRLDYFKEMSYDDIRLIFKFKFNSNMDFLLKTKEQMEEEESRALQSINETPAQKAAKRRKLNKEVEDLKRHLEIVPDEDDDVYTEATPLARKTCLSLEESKEYTWSSKGQELEATGIVWCEYFNILNYAANFVSRKKEKLLGLANTLLTKNCSAVLLKKLPKKLGDPRKFLISFDFLELEKCMALADLGTNINLMPLSIWKKLMLPELVRTRMTLELANRSIAYPDGIAEDVFVQVGKFTFLDDFVVIDYDVDPCVPLILRRPFLRTARALVDVYREELILRDDDEKLIFQADSTSKYTQKHGNESINMINFIDITCEDRFQKVLKMKKSNHPFSGSTTSPSDSSPSLIPFKTSDSLLEEFANELAFLEPFPPGDKDDNFDPEADLREIKYLLN